MVLHPRPSIPHFPSRQTAAHRPVPERSGGHPWCAKCRYRPLAHGKDPFNRLRTRSTCGTLAKPRRTTPSLPGTHRRRARCCRRTDWRRRSKRAPTHPSLSPGKNAGACPSGNPLRTRRKASGHIPRPHRQYRTHGPSRWTRTGTPSHRSRGEGRLSGNGRRSDTKSLPCSHSGRYQSRQSHCLDSTDCIHFCFRCCNLPRSAIFIIFTSYQQNTLLR